MFDDTEPFELKPTITRKRIQQGLHPRARKHKDTQRRIKPYRFNHHAGMQRAVSSKTARDMRHRNGSKEWGRERDAWAKPNEEDKSSRHRMRLIKQWWQESTD